MHYIPISEQAVLPNPCLEEEDMPILHYSSQPKVCKIYGPLKYGMLMVGS
jgi:hypothetical protein